MEGISVGLLAAFAGLIALSQGLVKLVEKVVDVGVKKHRNSQGNRRDLDKTCPLQRDDRDRILRISDGQKRMEGLMSESLIEARASKNLLQELRDGQRIRMEGKS